MSPRAATKKGARKTAAPSKVGQQFKGIQESLGPDFDEYAKNMKYQAHVREYTSNLANRPADGLEMTVNTTPAAAVGVAESGEIRNGFHPGSSGLRGGRGAYYDNRTAAEDHLFGIPPEADHTERPVYGYLRTAGEHGGGGGMYGSVAFDIHPNSRRRVTTTYADSLDSWHDIRDEHMWHDDPVTFNMTPNLNEYEAGEAAAAEIEPQDLDSVHMAADLHHDYRELQFHGGSIPKSDIKRASIVAPANHGPYARRADDLGITLDPTSDQIEARSSLRAAGIPVQTLRHREYQPTLSKDQFGTGKVGYVPDEHFRPPSLTD